MYKFEIPKSGHIPECPFTLEQLRQRGKHCKKLNSLRQLEANASYDLNHIQYRIYKEIAFAISQVRFSPFLSGRFSKAVYDQIALGEAHRKVKYKINKYLYKKQSSPLKFIFISEADLLPHQGRETYHFHCLVTAPEYPIESFSRLPKALLLINNKAGHQTQEKETFTEEDYVDRRSDRFQILTDPFEILLHKKTRRTVLEHTANLSSISSVRIENIYNQECLTDYVLKQIQPRLKKSLLAV